MNKRNLLMCACVLAAASFAACNDKVDWEESTRPVCGNGQIETGEICDVFVNVPCSYYDANTKWVSGKPGCSSDCKLTQGSCVASNVQNTCGNGALDAGEACDGTLFADANVSCETLVGAGATGSVACIGCAVSTVGCKAAVTCGNGTLDAGEVCDGTNFGSITCANYAGEGATGSLSCVGCASIDSTACVPAGQAPVCGDSVANGTEECDGSDFKGKTCADYKGVGATGDLACSNCVIDSSACAEVVVTENCGNNTIDTEDGEECDGENLNGATCASILNDTHAVGTLSCTSCRIDKTGCSIPAYCGDNVVNGSEECEGTDFNGKTCEDYKGKGARGDLKCNVSDCTIDATGCVEAEPPKTCPNGQIDGTEECDGSVVSESFSCGDGMKKAATIVCNDNCTVDKTVSCIKMCGDGTIDADEFCDGTKLNTEMAATWDCTAWDGDTYISGTMTCNNSCEFDTTSCVKKNICGNGFKEGTEECDKTDMAVTSCADYDASKFSGGTLSCSNDCKIVTTACIEKPADPACGDNALNGTEECETVDGNVVYKDNATCESKMGTGYTGSLSCNNCQIVTTACQAPATSDYPKTYTVTLPVGDTGSTCKSKGYSGTKTNVVVDGAVKYSMVGDCSNTAASMFTTENKYSDYVEVTGFEGLGKVTFEVANWSSDSKGTFKLIVDGVDTTYSIKNSELPAGPTGSSAALGEFVKKEFSINNPNATSVKLEASKIASKARIAIKTITITAKQ